MDAMVMNKMGVRGRAEANRHTQREKGGSVYEV